MAETLYFQLDDGDAIARLKDGWLPQVWRPSMQQWVEFNGDLATEARQIDEAEALRIAHVASFGEFAPGAPEAGA